MFVQMIVKTFVTIIYNDNNHATVKIVWWYKSKYKTRAKRSYGACDEVGRAKSSYGMSSGKILRINILL